MASRPITAWEIDGETVETVADFIFLGSKITSLGEVSDGQDRSPFLVLPLHTQHNHHCPHWQQNASCAGAQGLYAQDLVPVTTVIKKQRHYFANKGPPSQGYGFSSSHVWM